MDPDRRFSSLSVVLLLVAIGLAILGVVYFIETSAHLPAYLPGHYEPSRAAGHIAQARKHHVKLGALCFALAIVAVITAWFTAATEV
jgi:hypothetical protein